MKRNIKKFRVLFMSILLLAYGCNKFLEVESLTKVSSDVLLSSDKGINMLLANLYNALPIEDFNYRPADGFNLRGWGTTGLGVTFRLCMQADEAMASSGIGVGLGTYSYFAASGSGSSAGNQGGYIANRNISIFLKSIAQAKNTNVITGDQYNRLWSEAHFCRAYVYYALAKRYGGVPLISRLQDDDYSAGDTTALFVPRATESDTWKFILSECDSAVQYLPTPEQFGSTDGNPKYRATKWAAYALKSRAALHAASLAKFGGRASFSGTAVTQKLVGIDPSEAAFFYKACLDASAEIINNSSHALYKPNPANPQEAAKNYQDIFEKNVSNEIIFAKAYLDGSVVGNFQGHDWDNYYAPAQVPTGFNKMGRFSPVLDLVDIYEDYTDDGTGSSAPIVTRTDGKENDFINTNQPTSAQIASIPFVKYSNPYEPFKNKDARLLGSIIVPGATFRGVTIVMQGGLITKDGQLLIYQSGNSEGLDGNTYFTYGPSTGYSGFYGINSQDDANYSATGFSVRKYLSEEKAVSGKEESSTTPWIDFRLAEVYLNYAEAAVESGTGDQTLAAKLINDLRKRAGHKDIIPLTADNVQKERRVELAFEGQRIWDLVRRREFHTLFNGSYYRKSLVQLLDLREPTPKYVFLRINEFHEIQQGARTFQVNSYYFGIPGTSVNRLINNPGY